MLTQYCATCGNANAPVARFCQACGSRLAGDSGVACPTCGTRALPGDRFCDECGASLPGMALLVVDETGWRVALPAQGDAVIGREDPFTGERPDIDLAPHGADAYGVSRRHALLRRADDGYRLEDLNSVNLTYVNDLRLEPGRAVPLHDGDRLSLGSLRIIFRQV